ELRSSNSFSKLLQKKKRVIFFASQNTRKGVIMLWKDQSQFFQTSANPRLERTAFGNANTYGGTMSTTTKKRKAGAALPSKTWHTADVLKAVYMAGRGASASEIARVISGTTPD